MGFSRQEYWSRLPFPSPGDLTDPGIELMSPTLQATSLPRSHQGSPYMCVYVCVYTHIYTPLLALVQLAHRSG